ncbi:MAG TPA: heme-binding protein [Thermoanaerobaculia bacterium]|nr:heme-binding protein [Thermoanaerobaculia bacterium]
MRTIMIAALVGALAADGLARTRSVRRTSLPRDAAGCDIVAPVCSEGGSAYEPLRAGEAEIIVRAAAKALDVTTMTIAVVDRAGRPLALFRKPAAPPENDDPAVGVARTAAFFSHNMAPLSSRTVRFISGIHFPPGITNTPSAALYGIENTNRGCALNVEFNEGKCLPPARSVAGGSCDSTTSSGCGPGIVTGKRQPRDEDPSSVEAGGIPLYRIVPPGLAQAGEGKVSNGQLIGAIGVVGVPGDPQRAEFAAASAAFAAIGSPAGPIIPVPSYPLPHPGNVFVDGIRLPFLGPDLRLEFNDDGLPTGVRRLAGTSGGTDDGTFIIVPRNGGCAPNGDLSGPRAGSRMTRDEVAGVVQRATETARRTRGLIRLPLNSFARMVIAVADVDGSILALHRMPDATVFSADVAVAKARNVVWFSENGLPGVPAGTAVTNRTIGFGGQPFFPPGIDSKAFDPREGPWYRSLFVRDLANPCSQGDQSANANQNGIGFFAGSTPLYRNGQLVGGLGVSGDGIEQDDYVSYHAAGAFLPPQQIWADRIRIDGVRLPMFKFPRHPEGVDE